MFRQMEKLIELLNEYEKENKSDLYYKFELENWELYCYNDVSDVLWTMQDEAMVICSKKFWFIKWLVKNEKIEYRKIIEKEIEVWFKLVRIKDYPNKIMEEDVEELLMLLSIQDEPIEFLVSILK